MNKIIKISLLLGTVGFLFFPGCKKNKPPETPDKPSGPTIISTNQIKQYTAKANDPNRDDEIRYIFDWDDGKFDTTDYFLNDSTTNASHAWDNTGNYELKVRAQDEKNAFSKYWSEELRVTVVTNHSPAKPLTPIGLNSGRTNVQYTFKTVIEDPDGDSVAVKFDWGNNRVLTWTPFYASGDTIQDTITYSNTGDYSLRVIAVDNTGNTSEWSDIHPFTIGNYAPEPLTPIGPSYGQPDTQYTFKTVVNDPDGDSIAVKFNWGNGRTTNWTKFYASGDTIRDTISYADTGTFSIKVIAKDVFEDISESQALLFRVFIFNEGYIEAVFQATTRPDQGRVDTVGMQSSPAIAWVGGVEKIFIGSEGGQAYCIRTSDMIAEYYKYPDVENPGDEEAWGNSPAVNVSAGYWYIANDQGEIYCWTLAGNKVWRYPNIQDWHFTNWDFTDVAFNTSNGYVYVVNRDYDSLYVLSDASGTKVGYYAGFGLITAPTIDAQGNVYIGDDSGYVYKFGPTAGNPIWKHKLAGSISTSAIIDATGTIYVGANVPLNGYLYALNPDSTIKWTYTIGENILIPPTIGTDNNIYFCDDGGMVHAVDYSTGLLKAGWSLISLGANGSNPAFAADGYFYLNTGDQRVFCISINGTVRWVTQLPVTGTKKYQTLREDFVPSPVIGADGDIYVAAGERARGLYRLQGRGTGTSAYTPWPMFRHDRNHSGKVGFVPGR